MVQRQQHRGPDDRGMHSAGPATLGMCRLAIIDPANGHQPMQSPDGRFTLVFNGAIYNFRGLRGELAAARRIPESIRPAAASLYPPPASQSEGSASDRGG